MRFRDKLFLKLYCYIKLPIIAYCRPRVLKSDYESVEILIPLSRRTKNHLGSMYFGALSVGADFSAGLMTLNILKKNKSKAKLIFKDFKATFLKRGTSDVRFVCKNSKELESAVTQNASNRKRVNFKLTVKGYCGEDLIADFILTTSIK